MSKINHPNALSDRIEQRPQKDKTIKAVLVVETDLATDANDPAYDKKKLDSLVKAVGEYAAENTSIIDVTEINPKK